MIFTRAFLLLAVAALLSASAFGQAATHASPEVAIRGVLDAQVAAWNHHQLEQFMQGYWNSPELTFFSGATETKGWQPTLERYRKRYQANGQAMGKLDFSDLQIEMLGPEAAFVRGRFHLVIPEGKQPSGLFTLIFRKFPEGWRIVHDHTCSE